MDHYKEITGLICAVSIIFAFYMGFIGMSLQHEILKLQRQLKELTDNISCKDKKRIDNKWNK